MMSKAGERLSSLFRSLGPDDSRLKANSLAAAKEAQQRWPLFRTVAAQTPPPTPELSAEDKARWEETEPHVAPRKLAKLSVPSLSEKLAATLGHFVAPEVAALSQSVRRKRVKATPPEAEVVPVLAPAVVPAKRAAAARSRVTPKAAEPSAVQAPVSERKKTVSSAAQRQARKAAPEDASLASVFQRIEAQGGMESSKKLANSQSAPLQRRGKR